MAIFVLLTLMPTIKKRSGMKKRAFMLKSVCEQMAFDPRRHKTIEIFGSLPAYV
jgi:hypothetical protein